MISDREARGGNQSTAAESRIRGARISLRIFTDTQEVAEDFRAELGVFDFRMELKAEQGSVVMSHRLDVTVRRTCQGNEIRRQYRHLVVVGLPHLESVRETFEEGVELVDLYDGL